MGNTDGGNDLISGVLVLSLSAVIVKIIGLIYKIPMLRLLGSEGMGYFNSAYEIYALFCVISTTGLPVAVSVLISSSGRKNSDIPRKIFKVSLGIFLLLGIIGTIFMTVCARPLASVVKSDKTVFCIMAISPAVFFICVASAYRGYFQGLGKMIPTAVSQVIEALGKLFVGLLFAFIAFNAGFATELVAAFAVLGLTVGGAVSALYLVIYKKIIDGNSVEMSRSRSGDIASKLIKTAVPITLSSTVMSAAKIIDMTMILRRLQDIGYSETEAFSVYGSYTTLALPLFNVAPALTASIAMSLIPVLSSAIAADDLNGQSEAVSDALRLTAILAMPISFGLSLFSRQILEMIFASENDAILMSAPLLSLLGLSVTLSCLISVGNAVLQAYGQQRIPIYSMGMGAVVKAVSAYALIGNESVNAAGAPISTLLCDATVNIINFYYIGKCVPRAISVEKVFLRPFLAAAISLCPVYAVFRTVAVRFENSFVISAAAMIIAAMLYLPVSLVCGAVDLNDVAKIPILRSVLKKYGKNKKEEV